MDYPTVDSSNTASDITFKTLVDQQPDGIIVLDKNRHVVYFNPAAEQLLGPVLKNGLNKKFDHPVRLERPLEIMTGEPGNDPAYVSLKYSETRWGGEPGFLVNVHNITSQKKEEELLRQAIDAADTRTSELEAIKFVADQMNQVAMLEDAVQAGLETVLAILPADVVWILLKEQEAVRMVAIFDEASPLRAEKKNLDADFESKCLSRLFTEDFREPIWMEDGLAIEKMGLKDRIPPRFICVPLESKGKRLGVLNVSVGEDFELTDSNRFLLKSISYQLSVALSRSNLFSEKLQVRQFGESLGSVSRTISSALDLPAVLQNIVQIAVELSGAAQGSLGLLTPNGQHLTYMAHFPEDVFHQSLSIEDNLVWDVLNSKEPVLVGFGDSDFSRLPDGYIQPGQNMIIVPVTAGEETMGVLELKSEPGQEGLTEFDMALIESLGMQAGVAVNNSQLFFEVQQLTITDALTGLNNQKSFNRQAIKEMERAWRYKRPLSILSIVVDSIKEINQQHGEENGDSALKSVAAACMENLRRVDLLSRYEGNNYMILLPETNGKHAYDVAERLRRTIAEQQHAALAREIPVTVSIGVAEVLSDERIDLQQLIGRANHALYKAVQAGGNLAMKWEESHS